MDAAIFKAHDIRFARELLDAETKNRLACAVAEYFAQDCGAQTVVLGRDARLGGEGLLSVLQNEMQAAGMDVLIHEEPIGTCHFYYSCMQHPHSCGVMVTASHNPGSYLGMKIVGKDLLPISMGSGPNGGLKRIQQLFEGETTLYPVCPRGRREKLEDLASFTEYSLHLAGLGKNSLFGMHVACDFLHGSNASAVLDALTQAGVSYEVLHQTPDGSFPAGDPNPGIAKSMQDAHDYLKTHPHPLLFAYDGDGDRMDLLYEGRQLPPSCVLWAISDALQHLQTFSSNPRYLLDVKASPVVLHAMQQEGKKVALIRNGHSVIKARLHTSGTYFCAAEESAHYYYQFPQAGGGFIPSENTIFFTLMVLKTYQNNPQRFLQARALADSFFRQREWAVTIKDAQQRSHFLNQVRQAMESMHAEIITEDADGFSYGALLYRHGIHADLSLESQWFQVFQRISESEDSLVRFEVIAANQSLGLQVTASILEIQEQISQTT
ncbi:hypothetical protein [Sphaerochaeta sp.]|uniref:hypothetical protein n=1 Tax=Sphaerochaeta sp. TaxID=1972642 RepID=UPI002FC74E02